MPLTLKSTGGGSVTLASAVTAADTTLTVPAQNGNIVVSDGSSNVTVDGNLTVVGATTLSGNPAVSGTVVMGSSFMRNRIINGDMRIDQRNAGASVTPSSGAYTLDRWAVLASQTSKFSIQQNAGSVTPPNGFKNYLGVTSLSSYSIAAGDYFSIFQIIEGYNIADLGWGASGASTVTLSFWVRSSLTGTFGGVASNQYTSSGRYYPFTYTISVANTWEYKTITIAGDTTGTWGSTNGNGIVLQFGLGVGSTYSSSAGSWTGTYSLGATGATSVVGTNGATFYITGVQLEVGTVATPFERRQYTTELALCQRYYQKSYSMSVAPGTNSAGGGQAGAYMCPYLASGNTLRGTIMAKVTMRAAPTVSTWNPETGTGGYWAIEGGGSTNQASAGVTFISENSWLIYSVSSPVAGHYYIQHAASAEL